MSKTTNRVLSMVLAVLMLVTMFPGIALAEEATDFATTYVGTAYDGVTISNSALLVDSSITDADGTVITRAWDGKDYLFTVGTNAFATTADAFAKAVELEIACPDILLYRWDYSTGTSTGTNNLNITMPCRVFGRKWTVAPMNEMTEDFSAIKSGITDWTLNTNFVSTVDSIVSDANSDETTSANNLIFSNTIQGKVEIYGIRFFDSLYFGSTSGYRAATAGQIDIKLQNVLLHNGNDGWTGSQIRSIYAANSVNTDSLTFKNVYFRRIRNSRFFQQEQVPAHVTFDSCYFNKDEVSLALTNNGASNFWFKQNTLNGSITYKDSYLPMSNDAKIFCIAAGLTGTTVADNQSLEVTFDNNVFNNYNDVTATGLIDVQLDAYTSIKFTNNYAYNTLSESKSIFVNRGTAASRCADGDFVVTGNMLLGFTQGDAISTNTVSMTPIYVEKNFVANSIKTSVDAYKTVTGVAINPKKGLATGASGSYYFDYDMTMLNTGIEIQTTTLDDGKVSVFADSTVKQATVLTDGTSALKLKVTDIPNGQVGSVSPTKTMYSDEACTQVIAEYDLSKLGEEIDTVYVKFEYAGTSYSNTYKVSLVNTNLVSFNDMLAQGIATFRDKTFAADSTTVYLPKGVTKDGVAYAVFAGVPLKFVVDNAVVFEYSNATIPDAVCKTDLILPAGNYGTLNLHSASLNYYGANFGVDPIDDSKASVENNFDWAFNTAWDTEHDTEIDIVNVRTAAAGTAIFDGITLKRAVVDSSRAVTAEVLHLKFTNLVIDVDNYYTANGVFQFTNARLNSTTSMADNPDSFTLQNVYVAKNPANQLIHEPIYPTMVIDRMYLSTAVSGQPRAMLGMHKLYGTFTEVQPTYTIKNSNLRATAGTNYAWIRFDNPNGVDVNLENNIFISTLKDQALLSCNDTSSVVKINNNTILYKSQTTTTINLFGTTPAYADGSQMDGNRIVGVTENRMNTGNLVLTNTYYSPSYAGVRNPADYTGVYVEGMGDNAYYYDFNMTTLSGTVDGTVYPMFGTDADGNDIEVLPGLYASDVYVVDASITEAFNSLDTEDFVVRKWNGVEYSFYPGEILYTNLADAYAAASSDGVERPQIVILGWPDGLDLNIETASDIYTANWNTAPMKEMTEDFDAIKSEGKDWTVNSDYLANEVVVANITASAAVEGNATVNGITITKQINLASERTTSSNPVEFVLNNSRLNATDINVNGVLAGNANTSEASTDKLIFRNFWLDKCTNDVTNGTSRFFGDNGTNMWANIEFDHTYADFTSLDFKFYHGGNKRYQYNDHAKAAAKNSSFVIKNSNFRKNDASTQAYWNISRTTYSGSGYERAVTFDNNVFYNWINESSIVNTEAGTSSAKYNYVNKMTVTNNFIQNTTAAKLFRSSGTTTNQDGTTTDIAITVTGNKLLGVTDQTYNTSAVIDSNFWSPEVLTLAGHKEVAGTQYAAKGQYYLDYDMTSLNTEASKSFNEILTSGAVIGGVAFNKDNTAVYLPAGATDSTGTAYLQFAGKLYSFTVDNVNIFANGDLSAVSAFENVILPAGDYGDLTITTAQNFYGANIGINPNDKSDASAENNYEWTFNEKWDTENSTNITKLIVDAGIVGEDLLIDGVSISMYDDSKRTLTSGALYATIQNSIFENVSSGTAILFTGNARSKNYTDDTVGAANKDSLTVKDSRVVSTISNQLFDEWNVPILTADGLYLDGTASGKKRSALAFFKSSPKSQSVVTIKNSNLRNGPDNHPFMQIQGGIQRVSTYDETAGEWVNTDTFPTGELMRVVFDNNIVYNPIGSSNAYLFNVYTDSVYDLDVTNNIFIDNGRARLIDINSYVTSTDVAESALVANMSFDSNRFLGFSKAYISYVDNLGDKAPAFTNTYYASTLLGLEQPAALTGEYAEAMGENAYYLDYNMTVLNNVEAELFSDVLANGLTVGDVKFTTDNTAVYLPKGTGEYHMFAGKVYKFVADGVNIFANNGTVLPDGALAFENVILPSGSYGTLDITKAQKFYGTNMGINPNDKSTATADNNFDWAMNKDWDRENGTVVGAIVIKTTASGDISFDGITQASFLRDNERTMEHANINLSLTNVLLEGGSGDYLLLANDRAKNGRDVEANTEFGATNTDAITLTNVRVGDWENMRIAGGGEYIPANLTWDGLYYDNSISPLTNSTNGTQYTDMGYIKSGSANKNRSYTIKNSNLRGTGTTVGNRPIFFYEGGYATLAEGYTNTITFDNNVVYNFASGGQAYFTSLYAADLSAINVTNNTFIQTSHSSNKLFGVIEAGKATELAVTIDGNSFVGLKDALSTELVTGAGAPAATDTFHTSNVDAHKNPEAILGEKVAAMGDAAYWLDFARTKKSTDGYADFEVPADSVVYLPIGGQEYFEYNGTIYKFAANGTTIVANSGTETLPEAVTAKANVILTAGYYGVVTVAKPQNFLGSNAGINPNVTHEMTNEDAASGFDWEFNPEWDIANATRFDTINIDANVTAGDFTFDGVVIKKYYDDRRASSDVVNVAFKNFVLVDAGNANAVFNMWSKHAGLGLGNDKFDLVNGRVESMISNQLFDELNVPNITIDGLYLDAAAAGKKRSILSFFKFAKQQQSKIVIKNSNIRNGVGANSLLTVTGALDYNGVFETTGAAYRQLASYNYVAGDYVALEVKDNILYNSMGSTSSDIFNLYAASIYDVNITGNTIIDTKGNKLITVVKNNAVEDIKGSAIDGAITFDNNSVVGMDAHKVSFALGLNENPVMTNSYYNSSIEGLNNIFANTGKYHEAMNGGAYYADVARTQLASEYTEETVATVNGEPVTDLTAALENAVDGDVITLVKDVTVDEVFVVSGVTLDLNGNKLTTEYALGYDDSNIIDSNMTETSGIYVAKKALQVAENNSRLPVYDSVNGCYIFASIDLSWTYYEDSSYYFGPEMASFSTVEGKRVNALFCEDSENTGVEITIHLDWETGDYYSTQDYVYKPHYVESYYNIAKNAQTYANGWFFATFSGDALKQADTVSVKTIVNARGCVAESPATEFSM